MLESSALDVLGHRIRRRATPFRALLHQPEHAADLSSRGVVLADPVRAQAHKRIAQRFLAGGDVAQIRFEGECALSRLNSGDGFDLGPAKGREGVHDGDADVDFGGLAVGIS